MLLFSFRIKYEKTRFINVILSCALLFINILFRYLSLLFQRILPLQQVLFLALVCTRLVYPPIPTHIHLPWPARFWSCHLSLFASERFWSCLRYDSHFGDWHYCVRNGGNTTARALRTHFTASCCPNDWAKVTRCLPLLIPHTQSPFLTT